MKSLPGIGQYFSKEDQAIIEFAKDINVNLINNT